MHDSSGNKLHALVVGCVDDSAGFVEQLKRFVSEVKRFKEEVKVGTITRRSPENSSRTLLFNPESHGKKAGGGKAFKYFSYHGLVVNTAATSLAQSTAQLPDKLPS